jgi:CHAT domain-containing protein/tetratricopeptide (TPR) repeat protein
VGCKQASWQPRYDDAHLKLQQGYYDGAIQAASEGYRQSQKKDALWSWRFRILQAEALMRNRQFKQSVDLLVENPPPNLPPEITARKRIVQGQALCRFNRRADGKAILNQAEDLIPSGSASLYAELAFARGNCAFDTPLVARQYFEKAAELARGKDPFIEASALGNVGYLLGAEGRRDEAVDWFQKVVPPAQAANSPLLEEKALGNLGESYAELGDYKRAIDNSESAEHTASDIGRLDDQEVWLVDLGMSYAALPGDYPGKAESAYLKALAIATGLHDAEIARRALHDLTQLALKERAFGKAEAYWKQEVAQIATEISLDLDATLDEAELAESQRDLVKAKLLFQRILDSPKTNALRRSVAQEWLGKIYWNEHDFAHAGRMFRAGLHTVEDALSKRKEEYRVSFLDQHAFFDTYIRFLVAQGKPAQALQVAEHGRSLAQSTDPRHASTELNIGVVQRRLRERNQIILDYQLTDDESYLWVLTPAHFQIFHLPSHQELHSLIDGYNTAIQEQRTIDDSFGGKELYKALVQPAQRLIPLGSQVIIVPSKILCLLNFETLIVPGNKPHYWVDDVVVQNLSSLGESRVAHSIHNRNVKELLLIGAPEEVNTSFPTLKHASDEIARVGNRFTALQERVISGAGATPESYKSSNPQQYRFIHFVTHGIANEMVPMESAIVLSGNAASYKLYARDIVSIPLQADLVTISACYGAGKRWYVSEGIVGLGWAFMRAGAHQVIAALWEVDDAVTPKLMDDLYTGLKKGQSAAAALRAAKLKMLLSDDLHRRPYYWASLQLYSGS